MEDEVTVSSGEVKALGRRGVLRTSPMGSCVAVVAYDPDSGVGAMAHVMFPGASRSQDPSAKTMYAEDAMQEMFRRMATLGARESRVSVCLIGGGNVLGDGHDSPGPETVQSLTDILGRKGITTVAEEVGGTQRRVCSLDVAHGRVTCKIGDSSEQRTLWETGARSPGPSMAVAERCLKAGGGLTA